MTYKSIVNGRRRTKTNHKSSPCHFLSRNKPHHLVTMFLTNQIGLRYFVEGHLVTISGKLFLILTIGFKEEEGKLTTLFGSHGFRRIQIILPILI